MREAGKASAPRRLRCSWRRYKEEPVDTLWQGKYRQEAFEFEGRQAILVFPETANGKWLLKTEMHALNLLLECSATV